MPSNQARETSPALHLMKEEGHHLLAASPQPVPIPHLFPHEFGINSPLYCKLLEGREGLIHLCSPPGLTQSPHLTSPE